MARSLPSITRSLMLIITILPDLFDFWNPLAGFPPSDDSQPAEPLPAMPGDRAEKDRVWPRLLRIRKQTWR